MEVKAVWQNNLKSAIVISGGRCGLSVCRARRQSLAGGKYVRGVVNCGGIRFRGCWNTITTARPGWISARKNAQQVGDITGVASVECGWVRFSRRRRHLEQHADQIARHRADDPDHSHFESAAHRSANSDPRLVRADAEQHRCGKQNGQPHAGGNG